MSDGRVRELLVYLGVLSSALKHAFEIWHTSHAACDSHGGALRLGDTFCCHMPRTPAAHNPTTSTTTGP